MSKQITARIFLMCAALLGTGLNVGRAELLVLENALARIVIDPQHGAKITQLLDKQTGLDFASDIGLRDLTGGIHQVIHEVERHDGDDFQGVIARARHQNITVEREMRLGHDSKELSIRLTCTNIGDHPSNIWLRWHPYLRFTDDPYAETSAILVPGPENAMRRIAIGSGQDAWFWHVPGYWIALNYKTGNGVWTTFRKEQVPYCSSWTHYGWEKTSRRSRFTMETLPRTALLLPGQSTQLEVTHQVFSASDELRRGLIADEDIVASQRFGRLVRENAEKVGRHTMVPAPRQASAIAQNRFSFHHRRRDRFALLDHAIVDAMFALPGDQSVPVRCRLYAHLFDDQFAYQAFRYRLSITNAVGEAVRDQSWSYGGHPLDSRQFDMREDVPIDDLPDGWYTFRLQAFVAGNREAVHEYVRRGRLSGHARAEATAGRRPKALLERERPFVKALRKVELPDDASVLIGFEEAGGAARQDWPLRLGVPFPQGAVQPGQAFTVLDGVDTKPTQTRAMSTWPDGSVRWMLVDFLANLDANAHRFVRLVPQTPVPRSDLAQPNSSGLAIDTGAAQWRVQDDGVIPGLLHPADLWWTTGQGIEYRMAKTRTTLVENGPVRARIRITGDYLADGLTEPIARGEIDVEFHRGKSFVHLAHTVTYIGDPLDNSLGSTGIVFRPETRNWRRAIVDVAGQAIEHANRQSVFQMDEDYLRTITPEDSRHEQARSTGAAMLAGDTERFLAFHQDFWRLYPSRMDASAREGIITYHYWPKEAGTMSWLPRRDRGQQHNADCRPT